eukprot:240844-Hanusia_phi.AAC.1
MRNASSGTSSLDRSSSWRLSAKTITDWIAQRFPRMKDNVFNAKFLRPHVARQAHLQEPQVPQPLPVAKLLDDRVRQGVKQYL